MHNTTSGIYLKHKRGAKALLGNEWLLGQDKNPSFHYFEAEN